MLCEKKALAGELRNWKTANPRRAPQRISGHRRWTEIALREEGAGRGVAELENSKSPESAPENFRTQKVGGNCSA